LAIALTLLYATDHRWAYIQALRLYGFPPHLPPFLDTHVAIAAAECFAKGVDVFRSNPCDIMGRLQFYSPLIPRMSFLGLHRLDLNAAGATLIGLYVVAIWLLFQPRNLRDAIFYSILAVSPPAVFALERGQLEVLIFVSAVLLGVLLQKGPIGRLAGYGVALAAGLLKMFPMMLIAMVVRERWRNAVLVSAAGIGVFLATIFAFKEEYALLTANIWRCGYDCETFWIGNLAFRLMDLDRFSGPGLIVWAGMAGAFTVLSCSLAFGLHHRGFSPKLTDQRTAFFAIGSLLMVSSYIVETNLYYRAMHLLLLTPYLYAGAGEEDGLPRPFALTLLGGVLALMWVSPFEGAWRLAFDMEALAALPEPYHFVRDALWLVAMAGVAAVAIPIFLHALHRFWSDIWPPRRAAA
jgi:hypothetical protein